MGRSDAERMARAIEDAGVHFQTGYFMRGMPAHQFLREQVRAGSFGSITRLRHSNFHAGALRNIFTPNYLWMTRLDESGIGGFGDLGTHSLDIMLWLLGDVEAVAATFASHTGHYNGLDETGEALLRFSSGVIGSLGAGWLDIETPGQRPAERHRRSCPRAQWRALLQQRPRRGRRRQKHPGLRCRRPGRTPSTSS